MSVEFEEGSVCESIGKNAFTHCTMLTDLIIPNSVIFIDEKAFYNCTSLKSLTLGNNVANIGYFGFGNCTHLGKIYFNATSMQNFNAFYNTVFNAAGSAVDGVQVIIGKNVTHILAEIFFQSNLLSVEFEEGSVCENIGDCTFINCKTLKSIIIPGSVTSIGENAFAFCESLTEITIPNSVTSIGEWAFRDCTSLTSVTIPNTVTSIGRYAFYECTSLTSVTFENPNGWWYTSNLNATSGTSISATGLSNTSTAAEYLRDTYYYYYWKRS